MKRAASVPTEIGGLEADAFHDAPGQSTVSISNDEVFTLVDEITQFARLFRHWRSSRVLVRSR